MSLESTCHAPGIGDYTQISEAAKTRVAFDLPWLAMFQGGWHTRMYQALCSHWALHVVVSKKLLYIWHLCQLHQDMKIAVLSAKHSFSECHTVSLSVSQSVLYWPISFWQAGSYSLAVTASLTYARSSFSVVLKMAYRSAARCVFQNCVYWEFQYVPV